MADSTVASRRGAPGQHNVGKANMSSRLLQRKRMNASGGMCLQPARYAGKQIKMSAPVPRGGAVLAYVQEQRVAGQSMGP